MTRGPAGKLLTKLSNTAAPEYNQSIKSGGTGTAQKGTLQTPPRSIAYTSFAATALKGADNVKKAPKIMEAGLLDRTEGEGLINQHVYSTPGEDFRTVPRMSSLG